MRNVARRPRRWVTIPGAGIAGEINYLIRDTFTTDRAAGAVNGTAAEPGPGTRTVVDTDGDGASITGGVLRIANPNSTSGDPGVWWTGIARCAGLMVKATATWGAFSGFSYPVGWDATVGSLGNHQFRITGIGNIQLYNNSVGPLMGTLTTGTHTFVVVVRATGAFYFVKPDGGSNYLLLYATSDGALSPLYPVVTTFSQTTFDVQYIRVPVSRWLPIPLVSDGFSAATSDGLGHTEGAGGGLGSGGFGETWASSVGTWAVSSGSVAASALSGGTAVRTVDCGEADAFISAEVTRTAGNAGIVARWTDASNYVYAIHTGTNVQLIKVVAATPTTLIDTAVTYSAGAELRLAISGTAFRVYYNNTLVGTEQTIADAALTGTTVIGLLTTNTGNTFDNFVAYARGTGGEYSVLDTY